MGKYSNIEYVCNSNADCCKGFLEFYNDRGLEESYSQAVGKMSISGKNMQACSAMLR